MSTVRHRPSWIPPLLFALLTHGHPLPADSEIVDFERSVRVFTLDSDWGKPLKYVTIDLQIGDEPRRRIASSGRLGRESIEIEGEISREVILAFHRHDHVPVLLSWPSIEELPTELTVKLSPGRTVGGIVENEQGEPIAGARVEIESLTHSATGIYDNKHYPLYTDSKGRWECRQAPEVIFITWITISHPHYVDEMTITYGKMDLRRELEAGDWKVGLKSGVSIVGTVADEEQRPVAGATVGVESLNPRFSPLAASDEQGRFRTERRPIDKATRLVATAPGFAPTVLELETSAAMEPVEITLRPGRVLRGRVVDTDGRPVPDVTFEVDRWKDDFYALSFETRSDADGWFEWSDAPDDTITGRLTKPGYEWLSELEFAPGDPSETFTLESSHRVRGWVNTSQWKKPVRDFRVYPMRVDEKGESGSWTCRNMTYGSQGRFILHVPAAWPKYRLRVEAEDYASAFSEILDNDGPERRIEMTLGPASERTLRIVTPQRDPAVDALVLCCPKNGGYLRLTNGELSGTNDNLLKHGRTNEKAEFLLPAESEDYTLLALHETGILEFEDDDIYTGGMVHLQSWASAEGTALIGRQPSAGADIKLWYINSSGEDGGPIDYRYETTTDEQGNFTFSRLRPGRVGVGRMRDVPGMGQQHAICVPLTLTRNTTARIHLGGSGRTVTGTLTQPAGQDGTVPWQFSLITLQHVHKDDAPSWHDPASGWPRNWGEPPYHFQTSADANGRFQLHDVAVGAYKLEMKVFAPPEQEGGRWGVELGMATREIIVPFPKDADELEAWPAGTFELDLRRLPEIGDKAPDFTIETMEGEPLKLRDFQGRYVLLHFWATWCGPCVAEMPQLEELYEQYKDGDRLTIINLSLDDDRELPARFAEKQELPFIQGYVGAWSEVALPNEYGVTGIPASFLIDPEGRMVSGVLRGEAVRSAVDDAMK